MNQQDNFNLLKIIITSIFVLIFSNTSTLFQIEVDSLDFVIKAILSHISKKDDKYHLVAFFSKSFFSVEYNSCYGLSSIVRVKKKSYIGLTQENSINFLVQVIIRPTYGNHII